jgi:hypothetical protein
LLQWQKTWVCRLGTPGNLEGNSTLYEASGHAQEKQGRSGQYLEARLMPDPSFSGTVSEDAQAPCTSISRKAVAMEAIVSAILALSGNPSELQQQLKNASQQLASSVELIPQAIQALDPAANSLGMLVLL